MNKARLSPRQKAAIIVRLLLDGDGAVNLARLNSDSQTLLAEEMSQMDVVDRQTRDAVIAEFCDSIEAVGVTFPGGLDGTLAMLGGRISDDSTDRLRRMAASSGRGDPWSRLALHSKENLTALAQSESAEVVALMLSKLPVGRASDVFASLARDRARAVAQAMSLTGQVSPAALQRIGLVLLDAADGLPRAAIDTPVTDRVGAILNLATADLRDEVLGDLERQDAEFAGGVRRAIFTFAHIPARVAPRDVPRIVRAVDQAVLLRALSARAEPDATAAEYILSNLSQRMQESLREERDKLPKPRSRDIEDAITTVIAAIRELELSGIWC